MIIWAIAQPSVSHRAAEYFAGQRIALAGGLGEQLASEPVDVPAGTRQQVGDGLAGARGQRRPGRRRQCPSRWPPLRRSFGPIRLQAGAEVPQLGRHAAAAAVDLPVDHQRAADAAADGDVEDDPLAAAGAEAGLREPGCIGVVADGRRQGQRLPAPIDQRRNRPSRRFDGS